MNREALFGFLASLMHDPDAAEGRVREAFARLTREVQAGRTPDNVRAWLFQAGRVEAVRLAQQLGLVKT